MFSMEVDKEISPDFKQKCNTRFIAYLRIVNLQFDLMKNKNLILEDSSFAEDILRLEVQKHHLSKQIADFIRNSNLQGTEVSQIEKRYELLLRSIATANLRD